MKDNVTEKVLESLRQQQALSEALRQSHRRLMESPCGTPTRATWRTETARYYGRTLCVAALLASFAGACTPTADPTAVSTNHGINRTQVIDDTINLFAEHV